MPDQEEGADLANAIASDAPYNSPGRKWPTARARPPTIQHLLSVRPRGQASARAPRARDVVRRLPLRQG
eukprot:10687383-Lingulodinium_polyedra.AAC.1